MTVLSMSIVVAPTAKAAAASGDLIKVDGLSSVYYLGANGKRYVFPNEATYFSWYKDFSGVITIPASEMEGYPLAANVLVRPGTKLVKSPSINTVYAVSPNGVLQSIVSEANAISLWGANWAKMVVDVPDSFFVNYSVGAPLALGKYPVGQLIKTAGSPDVMVLAADGSARKFASQAAFDANNYSFNYVATVPSTFVMPTTGTTVSGFENGLDTVSQNGVSSGPIASGSGVSVALSSDTPAATSIPAGVSRIELAKVNLTASNDGNAIVNSITITRTGLGNSTDFPNIWIEKAGVRLTAQKSINSSDVAILTFSPALNIAAGQTVILSVVGSVHAASGLGSSDALTIKAAADIDASGASVSGSFPISGNLMSFANGYAVNTATFAAVGGSATYTVGDEGVVIDSFSIADSGATTRDLTFKSITLKNTGNADLSQVLGDLHLEKNGTKVSESTTISGKNVTFVLANGGLQIDKGDTTTFKVVGSVIYQDASNNNVTLKLNKAEDLNIVEATSGYAATVAGEAVSLGATALNAGDITISKAASSPSAQSVTKSTKGITALLANIKANQAFTADGMVLTLVAPTSSVTHFENIKLYVNNVLVDSLNADASGDTITYNSSVSIKQGNNEVKVVLDTTGAAVIGDSITVKLNGSAAFDTPVFANDESATSKIGGSATAAVITVATAGTTASRSDGFSTNKLIVKGATNSVLDRFTVKAQNDNIKITSIALGANTGSGTKITDSNLSDLQLFVNGSQIGATKSFSATGVTFGSLSLVINKDATQVVELRGSLSSSETAGYHFLTLVTFTGEDSNGKSVNDSSASSVQLEVADSGTLTIAKDGDSPIAGILAAATTGNSMAKFKFTATNDDITLTKIYISNVKGITADPRVSEIDLFQNGSQIGSAAPTNGEVYFNLNSSITIAKGTSVVLEAEAKLNQIDEAAQTNKDVQLAITKVTANSSAGTELSGANNAIVNFAASARTLTATSTAIATSLTVSDVTGIATGTVIKIGSEEMLVTGVASASSTVVTRGINGTAAAAHNIGSAITKVTAISADSFRIRKTYPVITVNTLPSTVLTAGDNVVASIKVSAQANADVTISAINLTAGATVGNVVVATSTALNSVRVAGSIYSGATVTPDKGNSRAGSALSSIAVVFTSPVTVAAGTSKTIDVVVNVSSLTSTNNNITTKIASDSAFAATGSFIWSDNSNPIDPTATYAGSYKVIGVPTISQTLSQN